MISTTPIENFDKDFEVVSLFIIHEGKILLLKRQENRLQGNKWGPPAGKVENRENLKKAIYRENFEETGIKIEDYQLNKDKKCYYVRHDDIDFMFYVYSVELITKPKVIINSEEHSEYSWFTPQEALGIDLVEDEEIPISDFF